MALGYHQQKICLLIHCSTTSEDPGCHRYLTLAVGMR